MKVAVKRIYEEPSDQDGVRILVDRLWPRGITKSDAKIDLWLTDLTPSTELRTWFHEDKAGRKEMFTTRYQEELKHVSQKTLDLLPRNKHITLITAVTEIEHSHIPVLKKFLEKL